MMRALVCGGRDYSDAITLFRVLDQWHKPVTVVIQGDARGADTLAAQWALSRKIKQLPFPADWKGFGKNAGAIRNRQMIEEGKPDLVIAFPGGKGTTNMINQAISEKLPVYSVSRSGDVFRLSGPLKIKSPG
jgi:predicted polyphosphate/ATP-dependent NAD kinase